VSAFEHDALIYDGRDEFIEHMLPFVRDGIDRGESVLAVTSVDNAVALQDALGADGGRVEFRDSTPWYASPGKAFKSYADYVAQHRVNGDGRLRVIGEPLWPVGSPEAVAEWAKYESVLNVAFAEAPAWIVCPYDASALPDPIVEHALHTHPALHEHGARVSHGSFVDPDTFWALIDDGTRFDEPPPERRIRVTADLAAVRAHVAAAASAAGLSPERVPQLLVAVHEVAINALTHGGGDATLTTWIDGNDFVCEIADGGRGMADRYVGYTDPAQMQRRGRGFWIARQFSDLVEVRSSTSGTRVRLRLRRA
jgi:anti-sigma regulatory factor (Ser/Thr protein kinase)